MGGGYDTLSQTGRGAIAGCHGQVPLLGAIAGVGGEWALLCLSSLEFPLEYQATAVLIYQSKI